MLRILLASALVLASAGAYAQFNGCRAGFCPGGFGSIGGPGFGAPAGTGIPPSPGRVAMVDGVSRILQTDGASTICLAGGC